MSDFPGRLTLRLEDQTNLLRHARANAQEALALARARALEFDNQVKTNEALKLTKTQAHLRDEPETVEGTSDPSALPLDRESLVSGRSLCR